MATLTRGLNRGLHGGRGADNFHRHIRAMSAGSVLNGCNNVCLFRVNTKFSTKFLGQFKFLIGQIHCDYFPATRRLERLHD